MIKNIHNLTESDKRKFYEAAKADYTRNYNIPWAVIETGMRNFIDSAFDDKLLAKMSSDDQIDAAHCRKAFGNKKPSIYDFVVWQTAFATHSEYIDIPD